MEESFALTNSQEWCFKRLALPSTAAKLKYRSGHQEVHTREVYFQEGIMSQKGRKCLCHCTAHSGGQGTTDTYYYFMVLTLPMMYRLAIDSTIRSRKKNREKILRIKNYPFPFVIFPPFTLQLIKTVGNYPELLFLALKFNFLFTIHENNIIAHKQDLASLKTRAIALIFAEGHQKIFQCKTQSLRPVKNLLQ